MQIDSFTVLLFALTIKLVLGGLFAVFWLKNRASAWFLWWGFSLALGSVTAALFMLRTTIENYVTLGIGNAFLLAAVACTWQGTRTFEKRAPLWLPVVAAPLGWLAVCLVPGFIETIEYRIALSSMLVAPMFAMAGWECWCGRRETLSSRWPVIVLFGSLTLFFALRVPLMGLLPFPFGALPMQPGWLGAFNLILFGHTFLIVVLVVAMSKERLELEQRTKAQTDPLTGALNRRAFMARGERLIARHSHEGATLSLLFLDLDHFKSLNDRFGHSGGDDVLTCFVGLVNSCIRPTDFLFRMGGEEFCCLLPYTDSVQAIRVAERIRQQVEAASVIVAGLPAKATVSIGIASTDQFGYDLDALIRQADSAVYAAKRAGRNRVEVSNGPRLGEIAARLAGGGSGALAAG
jgi:diguanylate cyclase (GGDEF)-like protein